MILNNFIVAIQTNCVQESRHAREEAEADNLTLDEILFSVTQGEIIEDYPNDNRPYPSCLVYGNNPKGEPIHSVWGYNQDTGWIFLITVYRPDPNKWINWRIRRKNL